MELALVVEGALQRPRGILGFAPALEQRYQIDSDSARRRHLRIALGVAIVTYACFSTWDWVLLESAFWYVSAMSALVALSGIGALLGLQRLPPRHPAREWLGILPSMLAYLPPLVSVDSTDATHRALWMMVLPLMIIYTNGCIAPPFRQALVHSAVALLGIGLTVKLNALPATEAALVLVVSLATALFTLLSCYWMETAQRRAYLLALRERLRNEALARSNQALEQQSSTDPLTGAANRRALMRRLDAWQAGAGTSLTLLMIDVDHFKAFNDNYGHLAGDHCLQRIVQALDDHLEPGDCLARYGGEEFVVLLPERDAVRSEVLARQLLEAVRTLAIEHCAAPAAVPWIRISIGGAWTAPGPNLRSSEALLEAADRQLYLAKRNGRDRLSLRHLSPELPQPGLAPCP